ncbi:MAG: PEPxxWA-CTERM sorting domain-containing protein [Gemmatimonadota bacterium]
MRLSARAVAVALLITAPLPLSAQLVASDASYTITRSIDHPFNSIVATGTKLAPSSNDDAAVGVAIAPFSFYGNVYSTVYVSTNGLLAFGGPNFAFGNLPLSTPTPGIPIVAAYWDDLLFDASSGLYALVAGNVTTIEWNNPRYENDASSRITVQAILNSVTGVITLNYGDVNDGAAAFGASATIGIKGPSTYAQVGFNTAGMIGNADRLTIAPVGISTVPEPSTWALMLAGLGAVGAAARRRRWQTNS